MAASANRSTAPNLMGVCHPKTETLPKHSTSGGVSKLRISRTTTRKLKLVSKWTMAIDGQHSKHQTSESDSAKLKASETRQGRLVSPTSFVTFVWPRKSRRWEKQRCNVCRRTNAVPAMGPWDVSYVSGCFWVGHSLPDLIQKCWGTVWTVVNHVV